MCAARDMQDGVEIVIFAGLGVVVASLQDPLFSFPTLKIHVT